MKTLLITAALPLLLMLTGASGYYVTPSTNRILPVADTVSPGTELTVSRGDIFYRQPVGQSFVAILEKDVSLSIAGKSATLPKGARLNVARVAGDAAAKLDGHHGVFCAGAESNWNAAKGMANLMTLGLFSAGQRHNVQTQLCLVDSDGDSAADRAILAGAKREEDRTPIVIDPTPISVTRDVPLPGESEARLRFSGGVGIIGNIGIDLEVIENGRPLAFSNGRTLISKGSLPRDVSIFGARFTLLSYDPQTKTARIRWLNGFVPGQYRVNTTTTYIPIYIPR